MYISNSFSYGFLHKILVKFAKRFLLVVATVLLLPLMAHAAPTNTVTTLELPPHTVASGLPATLTATVTANGSPVSPGLVTFCDDAATYCEGSAVFGRAQLIADGTASIKLITGIGSHSIKAVFAGTGTNAGSSSAVQTLTVTGTYPTTATIVPSGRVGDYTLTATVVSNDATFAGLSGDVSFLDTSNSNALLGTGTLGVSTWAQSFATGVTSAAGARPSSVATGDFDGDGKLDLAITNRDDNTVSVLLGDGSYKDRKTYDTGSSPSSVVVGDFNADGKPDLAVTLAEKDLVSVALGKGDGTFWPPVTYPTGANPESVATGDFDGDGNLDLAVTSYMKNTVSVLLGKGDGSFKDPIEQTGYDINEPLRSIVVGDFNGDGRSDLALAYGDTVDILLGDGHGTFEALVPYPIDQEFTFLTVGDFDGNGKLDLVLVPSDTLSNTVSVLLGKGDGTFWPPVPYATGTKPYSVATGDFDGDGKLDLAVTNSGDNTVSVLLGKGDGTFWPRIPYATGTSPHSVVAGDFNGDGKLDLAVTNYDDNTESVLLNNVTRTATATLSRLSISGLGTHYVDASYPGDTNYSPSVSSTVPLTGSQATATTTTALMSSSANANQGTSVTFITIVTSAAPGIFTGTVQFLDGTTLLGTAPLNAQGVAAYTTSALTVGSHTITAIYLGSANFNGSTSATVIETIASTLVPDFSITTDSTALALRGGQKGTVTVTLTPSNGFTGVVAFSCTGLPNGLSCALNPGSVTVNGSNTPVNSQVTITANSETVAQNQKTASIAAASFLLLPGGLLGCVLAWQRKKAGSKTRQVLMLSLMIVGTFGILGGLSGCGSGLRNLTDIQPHASTPLGTSALAGTYLITVTGVDGSLTHTTAFALSVTK